MFVEKTDDSFEEEEQEEDLHVEDVLGVEMVAFVDFEIYKGTIMSARFPTNVEFQPYSLQFLANCSLPDGAHLHETDQSYTLMNIERGTRYGISFFKSTPDKSVSRGAVQRSIVIVSKLPHLHLFEKLAYETLDYSVQNHQASNNLESLTEILSQFYSALKIDKSKVITTSGLESTSHHVEYTNYQKTHKFTIPATYHPCVFNGASLLFLYHHLKVKKKREFIQS